MRSILCLCVALAAICLTASADQQRILRRVIKSTPTASNLSHVRMVTVRSPASQPERGGVAEITSKEAAAFSQRNGSANETTAAVPSKGRAPVAQKPASTTTTTSTTTLAPSTTLRTPSSTTTAASSTAKAEPKVNKVSERQQLTPAAEVELLAPAPSNTWQMISAVEMPAAALIAAGTRPAPAVDLAPASSEQYASASGDFLRSSASKTHHSSYQSNNNLAEQTFSRLRQQTSKTSAPQQQSFFYPVQQQQQQQQLRAGKTSNYQATKTHWYAPTTTTPRPAPIIQQQEPQYEQYVEQQQVEGAAPLGQAEPFAFDFRTQDNNGNGQYRKEESDTNGVVRGSYGYTDANGIYRHVEYVADHNGFRANIKSNEPGLEVGETQPASIRLSGGSAASPAQQAQQRFSSSSSSSSSSESNEWTASSAASERADLALAPPDFESSHKAERIRSPRQNLN